MMNHRSILIMMIFLAAALALAVPDSLLAAQTVSGEIQGFSCLVAGTRCPEDNMDPHLMLESDFV